MVSGLMKAIIGQGVYRLSKDFEHLAVPVEVWLATSQKAKQEYVRAAQQAGKGTQVTINRSREETVDGATPHVTLPQCVVDTLLARGFPEPTVSLMVSGAEELLNNPAHMAMAPGRRNEYLVSSKSKNTSSYNCCKVNTYNVTCTCRGYRSKLSCKHSLAVAYKENKLQSHLKWLHKQPTKSNKTVLLTEKTRGTGQKAGRPKSRPRMSCSGSGPNTRVSKDDSDYDATFTQCYHNNEPFTIVHKRDIRKDCYKFWQCKQAFEDVIPPPPHNLAIWHRGAWEYNVDNSKGFTKAVSRGMTDYYYHVKRACIRVRYPYFLSEMLRVNDGLVLSPSQRDLLEKELGF